MRCIKLEPGKEPYLDSIDNTLEALQEYVGGNIETLSGVWGGMIAIVNEEGVIDGLPLNGVLSNSQFKRDVLRGNVLLVRSEGDEFSSVYESDMWKVQKFWKPVPREVMEYA